jgi:phenylacetate-CoA ligase
LGLDLQHLRETQGADLTVWPPRYDANYYPDREREYWCEELECAGSGDRDEIIFLKLRSQLQYAWEHSSFYRNLWQSHGVSPATLKTLEDLNSFPVVQKSDLRQIQEAAPPFGSALCIPPDAIRRIHGTSGTTGRPILFGIGGDDLGRIAETHARVMWAAGLRRHDRMMICSFFSLYVGSWGALIGGERLGAAMFPFGAGAAGQSSKAVEWAQIVQPSAFYGTPSYALHLAETARRDGIDPRTLGFKILMFSGEPGAGIPATKRVIEESFGGICIDMGSMAEMTPWMTNSECRHRTGMHLWQDIVFTQVCDPQTYKPVPYGDEGTPVYTHLERTSQPMIRLVSNDQARWTNDSCPCGRTYPRLPNGIYGRYDDMLIVRGKNIYPSSIEDVLREIRGFGGEFRIVVSSGDHMDELVVQVEHEMVGSGQTKHDQLRDDVVDRLRHRIGIRPVVQLVMPGSLPRTEFKSRRAVDNRDLYRAALNRDGTK